MRISSAIQLKSLLQRDVLIKALVDYIEITPGAKLRAMPGGTLFISDAPKIDGLEATWLIRAAGFSSDDTDTLLKAVQAKVGGQISNSMLRVTQLATEELIQQADTSLRLQKQQAELQSVVKKASQVRDGKDGLDGLRGPRGPRGFAGAPGKDGKDGKDLLATSASIFDLIDVERNLVLEKGQVLTWDGNEWTNLFIPQLLSVSSGNQSIETTPALGTTIQWKYHAESGEPHPKEFHTDSTDPVLITKLHVSFENNAGTDVSVLLAGLLPVSAKIYVSKVVDPSSAHLFDILSYTTTSDGVEITVSHADTPGGEPLLTNNAVYNFLFLSAAPVGGGVPEAPVNANYYVRHNGSWKDLVSAENAGLAENKTFVYDTEGNLIAVSGTKSNISITYLPDGAVGSVTKTTGTITVTKTFTYANGKLNMITVS